MLCNAKRDLRIQGTAIWLVQCTINVPVTGVHALTGFTYVLQYYLGILAR